MTFTMQSKKSDGFTILELLISVLILIPIMAAAVSLFSLGANQHTTEQNSIDSNQEAESGLEMMTMELAQAGSHGDRATTTSAGIAASSSAQSVAVASSSGFTAGDYVDVDTGANHEMVKLTAVTSGHITGVFRTAHASGIPVRLFAQPYMTGVIKPAGLGANASTDVTTLRFFGDINGDGNVSYVEYVYDAGNAQITRSMTPITLTAKNSALPLVRNIKPGSVQFTLFTDNQSIVTSATIRMTVRNTAKTGSSFEEFPLFSKVVFPSAVAASALFNENQVNGGISKLPPTPTQVSTWAQY
jgi:Tfp pilus assembly protein PilW